MAHRLTFWLCLLAAGALRAQSTDPTRPALLEGAAAGGTTELTTAEAGLQSILRPHGGKPAALINGRLVELGGRVGEARLVKIGEDHVVLRGPSGREVLRLTPAVDKKVTRKDKR